MCGAEVPGSRAEQDTLLIDQVQKDVIETVLKSSNPDTLPFQPPAPD